MSHMFPAGEKMLNFCADCWTC